MSRGVISKTVQSLTTPRIPTSLGSVNPPSVKKWNANGSTSAAAVTARHAERGA
eukprot:CAMPEP_0203966118 /NCGR_PEP_ID=MMETSP0359-20131031/95448_1 /ASSEMBLY_ACC=CAM_ASM_000338 /TAXON_ID=268821 /ORGANISM="Scrippsiella Hangoei, Strain SHTV-5" /LENGTH=53 /DNA_ID=CAMNT_0050903371 /DNA_START=83 /DNA_END=244 /DNA_ORIENTATION=+